MNLRLAFPLLLMMAVVPALAQFAGPTLEQRSRQVLDSIFAGNTEKVYPLFGDRMTSGVTPEAFAAMVKSQLVPLGKPERFGEPTIKRAGEFTTVTTRVDCPSGSFDFDVVWTAEGKIGGFFYRPAAIPSAAWTTPAYSHPDQFTSVALTVGEDPWKLPATLTVPKGAGPFPALVLVHGSGANDRDESVGGTKVFRDLAEGLSSKGIAVLRYDKRNFVHKGFSPTVNEETVDDAVRALALVRQQARIDGANVFLLGHSLGGYVAPRILKRDAKLSGGIVMAGSVRPIAELVADQFAYLSSLAGPLTPEQRKQADETLRQFMGRYPASYLADLKDYHADLEAQKLSTPLLILQGERDYQVTMKDYSLCKAALSGRTNVTFRAYPKLNHLFVAGEGKSTPNEYSEPGHIDGQGIEDIARWIKDVSSARTGTNQ